VSSVIAKDWLWGDMGGTRVTLFLGNTECNHTDLYLMHFSSVRIPVDWPIG
jgi:hypothetical protein